MRAMVKLAQIIADQALQPRESIDESVVADYAERLEEGDKFPPVVVVVDGDKSYLVDGFHRLRAYEQLEFVEVEAEVIPGSWHDAVLRSAGANAVHGQRRTNEDKRRAVLSLLADSQWSRKSDSWIAIQAKVSHPFVGKLRTLETVTSEPIRETADGRTMDTSKIGKRPVAPPPPEYPRTRVGHAPEIEPEADQIGGFDDAPDIGPDPEEREREEAAYRERVNAAFASTGDAPKKSFREEVGELLGELHEIEEWNAKHSHLNLGTFSETMSQRGIFAALEYYIDTFDGTSQRLEAAHNLIKKLRAIINELQQESIEVRS